MTNEEFERLVSKLEAKALDNPQLYKTRVLLLALVGNFYLFLMLVLVCGLFVASLVSIAVLKALAVKLILVLGILLWVVLKALWVKVDPPTGTEIMPKEAPALFKLINELRTALKSPKFHHVLITNDLNAGVCQIPVFGMFGWSRNYLLLGLPLMKAMTEDQFKAVLAHEFGHLAKGHGRFSNWIYRQRLRWSQLRDSLEKNQSTGSFLFVPFLNWFAPYFSAFTFPLARANEYEADATSVRLTSAQFAAEALTSVNLVGSYLEQVYWPGVYKQADVAPQPAFMPYSGMASRVSSELNEQLAQPWLELALSRKTTCADTHPALSDRLQAIGESARVQPPAPGYASDKLLGSALEAITEAFDQEWRQNVADAWQQRHQEMQEARTRLSALNKASEAGEDLTIQDAYERACLTHSIEDDIESAIVQLKALQERFPDDGYLLLALGARLLQTDRVEGYALVEQAMQSNERTIIEACEILRNYDWQKGNEEKAHQWHQQMQARAEEEFQAKKERDALYTHDSFESADLDEAQLSQLKSQLAALPEIREAYFVRKKVKYLPHLRCYALGFVVSGRLKFDLEKKAKKGLKAIQSQVEFPGETFIINLEGKNHSFYKKFKNAPGSRIK